MSCVVHNPNLFVITGGPGAGKTTLLLELEKHGAVCVAEVARQIIQEQVAADGDALPWGNREHYTGLMLGRSVAGFLEHCETSRLTFFDRGIPDVLCYARLIGLQEDNIRSACAQYRYNRLVFIAPPWQEIYATDSERKQTFAEAMETYRVMWKAYLECGYELIELPLVRALERAEFVIDKLRTGVAG